MRIKHLTEMKVLVTKPEEDTQKILAAQGMYMVGFSYRHISLLLDFPEQIIRNARRKEEWCRCSMKDVREMEELIFELGQKVSDGSHNLEVQKKYKTIYQEHHHEYLDMTPWQLLKEAWARLWWG